MGMSEKLQSIAEAQQKIHSAGQLSILEDSAYLSGSEVGNVITANDVTPIEHNLDITLRSKNLFDMNSISVSENLKLDNGVFTFSRKIVAGNAGKYQALFFPINCSYSGKQITISAKVKTSGLNGAYVGFFNGSKPILVTPTASTNGEEAVFVKATKILPELQIGETYRFAFYLNSAIDLTSDEDVTYTAEYSEIQIELGDTVTNYTPYTSDFSNVKVSRYGKNLFSPLLATNGGQSKIVEQTEDTITVSQSYPSTWISKNFTLPKTLSGAQVTISAKIKTSGENKGGVRISPMKADGNIVTANVMCNCSSPDGFTEVEKTGILPILGSDMLDFKVLIYSNTNCNTLEANTTYTATYKDIQIEISDGKTKFELYLEPQTAIANADGTVEGLTSLSPNMCLYTDTDGVNIDCKYYRDIDYYIDNLTTNIALTGGE